MVTRVILVDLLQGTRKRKSANVKFNLSDAYKNSHILFMFDFHHHNIFIPLERFSDAQRLLVISKLQDPRVPIVLLKY